MNSNVDKSVYRKQVRLMYIVAAACIFLYCIALLWMLKKETRRLQEEDNERFFISTLSNLNSNIQELNSLIDSFNENNLIMLNNLVIAFPEERFTALKAMAPDNQNDLFLSATKTMIYCLCLDVVDSKGNIIVSNTPEYTGRNLITETNFDLPPDHFQELISGDFETVIIDNPYFGLNDTTGRQLYLYSKPIPAKGNSDEDLYVVLGISSDIIDTAVSRLGDVSNWLNASTIGNNSGVFMVDSANDLITYGTLLETDESGKKASELGLHPDLLKDRFKGTALIDGIKCYISVRAHSSKLYGENQYLVVAVPLSDLYGMNVSVLIWNVCLFLMAILFFITYSAFVRSETMKNHQNIKGVRLFSFKGRNLYLSRTLAVKILPIVFTSALLVFAFSVYFQALMKLSNAFSESVSVEEEITGNLEESTKLRDNLLHYYDYQYESRAGLMAFIIDYNGERYFDYAKENLNVNSLGSVDENGNRLSVKDEYGNTVCSIGNSKPLEELKEANFVKNIYLISDTGNTLATTSSYWSFSLSRNSEDQSYEFWDILKGKKDNIIQDAMISDEGVYSQYIGCAMYYYTCLDENGNTRFVSFPDYANQVNGITKGTEITRHRGLIQFEVDPKEALTSMDSAKPEYILANTKISNKGFLIGFRHDADADDYYVFYSPIASMIGKNASELGITQKAFSGNYNGFQTINGVNYLQSFRRVGDDYIATAMAMRALYSDSWTTALFCAVFALIVMILLLPYTIFVSYKNKEDLYREESISIPIFRHFRTSSIWEKYTPSQKFEIIIKISLIILGSVFLVTILLEAYRFGNNSAILYIIGGEWDRGVHIFSLSACVVIIIISALLIRVFGHIAYLVASAFGSRMVTMMRLLISLVRAAAVLFVILFCLYLMGIDATSLLASAGIMSIVVGLGAQSLVGDLLAGIFIVMEGSIHVGDYIMIDNIRGKVIEIGLRTTRYEDDNQNIRIICNNEMKIFANMSMKYTMVLYNIPVPYGEDYLRIRKILNEEFLQLYEDNRFLKGIPACQGIEALSESSVDLRVRFMCEESERYDAQRFMYDQIMRIFMENNINIPFNQLDVHFDTVLYPAEKE